MRYLATIPSLIVALIGGSPGAGKLIIIASMILSYELPFALVPLLNFTSSKTKMGSHANSLLISSVTWLIGGLIKGINIYYLVSSFINLLLHGHMKLVAIVLLGEDTKFNMKLHQSSSSNSDQDSGISKTGL
ncbi:hypothetical protein EUTSA_v10015005mg [Eutrema salsugineum]|uniref:Uncharacterized protein n=1 Tax=Eutrema salsugineum TaxID=72664 RepID=V4N9J9_EUTSA|nr:hypothetical protein EUTSA_v10015005mg [Eutrema salsugineum]